MPNTKYKNHEWKSFKEFIEVANKKCNWLVLRNFEYLPNNFFGNDKDVDILCEDIDLFVTTMKLRKRSWGIAAYETTIEGKIVPFDVRFLGDNYYDKLWQYKMLQNKVLTSDNVPRMSDEDYFYSLIYHSKIQKHEIKDIYKKRFLELSMIIGLNKYKIENIEDNEFMANILSEFMEKNFYSFSEPIDINVPKNNIFFQHLSSYTRSGVMYKIPTKIKILRYVPSFIFKITPKKIKNIIKKVF